MTYTQTQTLEPVSTNGGVLTTETYKDLLEQISDLQDDLSTLQQEYSELGTSFSTASLSATTISSSGNTTLHALSADSAAVSSIESPSIKYSSIVRGDTPAVSTPVTLVNQTTIPLFSCSSKFPYIDVIYSLTVDGVRYPISLKLQHAVLMECGAGGYTIRCTLHNGVYYFYATFSEAMSATLTVEAWSFGDAIQAGSADYYGSDIIAEIAPTSQTEICISGTVSVSNSSITFDSATVSTLSSTAATIQALTANTVSASSISAATATVSGTVTANTVSANTVSSKASTSETSTVSGALSAGSISSTGLVSASSLSADSANIASLKSNSIQNTNTTFNKDNFIPLDTPSSNTAYNLVELPYFIGSCAIALTDSTGKVLLSANFANTSSSLLTTNALVFNYSTDSIRTLSEVFYADSKIYLKTYLGGKLYYSYNTLDATAAPETYSSINLPSYSTPTYDLAITRLSNTVIFSKGLTVKGEVAADVIDTPTLGSFDSLTITNGLTIGTTLSVSNGTGSDGQILTVNADGNPQWSLPSGCTYLVRNKADLLQWANDTHSTTGYNNDYTSVLIDLEEAATLLDTELTIPSGSSLMGAILASRTNTKQIYMAASSAALTLSGVECLSGIYCTDTDIKIVNLRISDNHEYTINGAGLVDRCYISTTASGSYASTFGLEKCSLVTDCDVIVTASGKNAYGVDFCKAVVNTSVIATGSYGYGYTYCTNIVNCLDRGSTTYGFLKCVNTLNTTGTESQCTTTIGQANNLASLYGNLTYPNVHGTLPIGANYVAYDGVDPTTLFGGSWQIIDLI